MPEASEEERPRYVVFLTVAPLPAHGEVTKLALLFTHDQEIAHDYSLVIPPDVLPPVTEPVPEPRKT